MKVCQYCGDEIATPDGVNDCRECRRAKKGKRHFRKVKADKSAREAALESVGLVKVKGALGGTYWE